LKFTDTVATKWKHKIDNMTHEELARMYRFERHTHPIFTLENDEVYQYFENAFNKFGGMTKSIGKEIGMINIKLCIHDWEIIRKDNASNICKSYLDSHVESKIKFLGIREDYPDYFPIYNYNFLQCPWFIEYEDKVCLKCRKKVSAYTKVTKHLDVAFYRFVDRMDKELPLKSNYIIKRELEKQERVNLARDIFKEG
jgi:hypothetical protein